MLDDVLQRLGLAERGVLVEQVPGHDARDPVADSVLDDDRAETLDNRVLHRMADTVGRVP